MTGYTGFNSSVPLEQEGNYLALQFTPPSWDGILTVELVGGSKGPVTLDEGDNFCVFRIASTSQKVKVSYTDGDNDFETTYNLSKLVLEPSE